MKRAISLWALLCCLTSQAVTWYVTPSGAGTMNGSSWGNATNGNSFQSVIDGATNGDQVWVACGTYLPTTTSNRGISFHMKNGVSIYGGFNGTESQLTQRVFECGPCSILSGEIGTAGISDNSYKVVWNEELNDTAIIDGFVISDGNDNRSPTNAGQGLGAGMYNHGYGATGFCHPIIRNCIFTNNRASWGSGAFNNGYAGGNTEPYYYNCIFYQNHGYIEAGGMDSYGVGGNASPTVVNTIFYENTSATNAGAMYAWGGNSGNSHPVLINCVFVNNSATNGYGGALVASNLNENGTSSSGSCTVTLQNCVVWNNSATESSPQFYVRGAGAQVVATYSNIALSGQNGIHVISGTGTGNLTTSPQFVNIADALGMDDCWMTGDDGLIPQSSSPLINAGSATNAPTEDLLGTSRSGDPDIGPYEGAELINTTLAKMSISLYPNPTSGKIEVISTDHSVHRLVIRNLHGQSVFSINIVGSQTVDISVLLNGLYLVQINDQPATKLWKR